MIEAPAPEYSDPVLWECCPVCGRLLCPSTGCTNTDGSLNMFNNLISEYKYCDACIMDAKDVVFEGEASSVQEWLHKNYSVKKDSYGRNLKMIPYHEPSLLDDCMKSIFPNTQ